MGHRFRHAARGLTALVAVTLALGAAEAQARFRLRTTSFSATSSPRLPVAPRVAGVAVGPAIGIPVASAATTGSVGAPYGDAPPRAGIVTRSVLTGVPAAAEEKPREAAPKRETVVKVAEPWCPSGRVVGSGAGFCEIN